MVKDKLYWVHISLHDATANRSKFALRIHSDKQGLFILRTLCMLTLKTRKVNEAIHCFDRFNFRFVNRIPCQDFFPRLPYKIVSCSVNIMVQIAYSNESECRHVAGLFPTRNKLPCYILFRNFLTTYLLVMSPN